MIVIWYRYMIMYLYIYNIQVHFVICVWQKTRTSRQSLKVEINASSWERDIRPSILFLFTVLPYFLYRQPNLLLRQKHTNCDTLFWFKQKNFKKSYFFQNQRFLLSHPSATSGDVSFVQAERTLRDHMWVQGPQLSSGVLMPTDHLEPSTYFLFLMSQQPYSPPFPLQSCVPSTQNICLFTEYNPGHNFQALR